MTSIDETLTYPTGRDDWLKTVAIGGVLTIFSFLFVPALLVYGYLIRAIRASLAGEPEPPAFGDWGGLLVDGIKAAIVGIVYMIVPFLVAGVTIGGSIAAMATGTRGGAAAGIAGLIGGLGVSFLLALAFGYLAVIGLVNVAREDRLGAAFDVDTIREVALARDYAVAWLVSVGVFVVASIVVGILNVVPFLGFVVGSFVFFYVDVVAANLWANGFAAAREAGDDTGDSAAEGEAA